MKIDIKVKVTGKNKLEKEMKKELEAFLLAYIKRHLNDNKYSLADAFVRNPAPDWYGKGIAEEIVRLHAKSSNESYGGTD